MGLVQRGGLDGQAEGLAGVIERDEAEAWEAKEIARYHVHGLRSKLGDADYVQTVRGVGYRLVVPQE